MLYGQCPSTWLPMGRGSVETVPSWSDSYLHPAGLCRSSGELGQYPLMSATRFLYQRFPASMISAPQ
jgi:hypothetical protein